MKSICHGVLHDEFRLAVDERDETERRSSVGVHKEN